MGYSDAKTRHFRCSYLKANKVSKMKRQGKLNVHIISESVLMLFTKKTIKIGK